MEIMFDDLTYEAQKRLLKEAGASTPEDMDWDTNPIAIVELETVEDSDDMDEELLNDEDLSGGFGLADDEELY